MKPLWGFCSGWWDRGSWYADISSITSVCVIVAQINVQRWLIRNRILYEFELGKTPLIQSGNLSCQRWRPRAERPRTIRQGQGGLKPWILRSFKKPSRKICRQARGDYQANSITSNCASLYQILQILWCVQQTMS